MTLKNAGFLALFGMLLLTLVVAVDFFSAITAFAADVLPLFAVLRSAIYLFAAVTLTVFLFVFSSRQPA